MMPKEKLRKADVVTALCLMLLGSAVLYGASRMPMKGTYAGVQNVWYVSPAVMPILTAALLIIFSVGVLTHALRDGGHKEIIRYFLEKTKGLSRNIEVHRICIIWIWSFIYIFFMLGHLNFYLAGFFYLCPFMLIFYRPTGTSLRFSHVLWIILLCAVLPAGIGYLFNKYLYVPLP